MTKQKIIIAATALMCAGALFYAYGCGRNKPAPAPQAIPICAAGDEVNPEGIPPTYPAGEVRIFGKLTKSVKATIITVSSERRTVTLPAGTWLSEEVE